MNHRIKGRTLGWELIFLDSKGFYIKFFKFRLIQKCKNTEKQKISLGN